MALPANTVSVIVSEKAVIAEDIARFELRAVDGEALPEFTAGAHIDVLLDEGPRQYSLSNDPSETHRYVLGVRREAMGRGGSRAMHDAVSAGQILQISRPRNSFELSRNASRSFLYAGGIGITPILSMARSLYRSNRPFDCHYFVRSSEAAAFSEDLIAERLLLPSQIHLGDARNGNGSLLEAIAPYQTGFVLYMCGPQGFMDNIHQGAAALGWPADALRCESFSASKLIEKGESSSFVVVAFRSGVECVVDPDESIVDALERVGVEIQVSCEQGVCGTCTTKVIEGTPDHRDVVLSADQKGTGLVITPCCSRSKSSRLVLDI